MAVAASTLDKILIALPEREQRRAISLLTKQLISKPQEAFDQAVEILDDRSYPIGYFVPLVAIKPEEFPERSAAYRAEIERRFATPEPSEPIDDFIDLLTTPAKSAPAGRKRARRS